MIDKSGAQGGVIGTLLGALAAGGLGYQVNSELAAALEAKEASYRALVDQCIERLDPGSGPQ
jgi:hypothetical protein